jgi:hypothetical protein
VTGVTPPDPTKVFPDVHMSNKAHHILSIGASIIDQADLDSIPTRIEFKPSTATTWWTAYGVESLPYITQVYPISGYSTSTTWATYLLFQLWNPHIGALPQPAPQVHLRVDGNIGLFTGGNNQTWATAADPTTVSIPSTGQSTALTTGAFAPSGPPAPLGTANTGTPTAPFATLPGNMSSYVGFRLTDKTLQSGTNPQLTLYFGTDSAHPFNATMEYLMPGTTNTWVPYNHFIGINDQSSWINGDTVPVRPAGSSAGTPDSTRDQFSTTRLTDPGPPSCLMKADPRSTRFGIFQMDTNPATTARITDPLWPTASANLRNGYGGNIVDPGGPVEHAPLRFNGNPYYPATLSINGSADARDTATTTYADNDGVTRPADATYPDPTANTTGTGSWTPYYTTSTVYHPIILNRPLRNVGELGYAFRDLPWKTLDFFTDKSADAGLLDVFCINDGTQVLDGSGNVVGMAPPMMVAGSVNLSSLYLDPNNSTLAPVTQPVLAGAIWDEISSSTVVATGSGQQTAQTMARNIASATSTTPMQNRS